MAVEVLESRAMESRGVDSARIEAGAMISLEEGVERGRRATPDISGELPCLYNRVREIVWHIPWYGFKTQARLAHDSGVSPAAISRLIRGHSHPTLAIALRVTSALSKRLGRPLDVREVFSLDGTFPTPSVCHLTGCRNCLPPAAYDPDDNLNAQYAGVKAGGWSFLTVNGPGVNPHANSQPGMSQQGVNQQGGR